MSLHPIRSAERSTELTPKSHDEALSPSGGRGEGEGEPNFDFPSTLGGAKMAKS